MGASVGGLSGIVHWGAVDGIFVTFGDRGTLPGLLRQFEVASTWPRDWWAQRIGLILSPFAPFGLITRLKVAELLETAVIEGFKRVR